MGKVITFADLFAGMGGTRIGFERAARERGFVPRCVFTSEIKPAAINALKGNFNEEPCGDIRKIPASEIPDFDVLLAGFPCQPFSAAGKGLGFGDTRGTLFFEIERILKEKQPRGFLLENVEGLVLHDREKNGDRIGRTLKTILSHLESLGYLVNWKLLDAKEFGVPQARKRVYIVGTKNKKADLENFPVSRKTVGEILEHGLPCTESRFTRCLLAHYDAEELYGKSVKDKRGGKNNIHSWDIGLKGEISAEQKALVEQLFKERRKKHWAAEIGIAWMDGMPLTAEQIGRFFPHDRLEEMLNDLVSKRYLAYEHPKMLVEERKGDVVTKKRVPDLSKPRGYNIVAGKLSFEFTKILDNRGVAPTLVAMDVSRLGVVDGYGIRPLTLREGLRLFGFPDDYHLEGFADTAKGLSQAFDLLGNTVVVPVIQAVTLRLFDALEGEK